MHAPRAFNLALFTAGLLGLFFAIDSAPDLFEFGGYLQRGAVHLLTVISTVLILNSGRNLVRR